MIKISFIIPSFNQGMYLEDALLSLIGQIREDIEIIVMDGGSSDNSLDIIKKYSSYFSYWQSRKDNGQSDAINQGIRIAKGEFVTWLNSDDVLLPGTLSKVIECISSKPDVDFFLGNVLWMDKAGHIIRVGKSGQSNRYCQKHFFYSNGGPSAFVRKSAMVEMGLLREDFHYMMDTELWYRLTSNGIYFYRIPFYCWGLRLHEFAKMSGHNFDTSPFNKKNHPSWNQKKKENTIMGGLYHKDRIQYTLWRLSKLFSISFYSRIFDKKYIGHSYKDVSN